MIQHIFKLVWNKRGSHFLLFLELFLSFLVLFVVFTLTAYHLNIYRTPLGFDTQGILVAGLSYPPDSDSISRAATKTLLQEELIQHPYVDKAGYTGGVTPFSGSISTIVSDDNGYLVRASLYDAGVDYAQAGGLNIIEGRWFSEEDRLQKYKPIVVNKAFRDAYFADRPILDSVILLGGERKIVGVVDHFRYESEFKPERNMAIEYLPEGHENLGFLHIRLKDGSPPSVEQDISNTIAAITKSSDFLIEDLDKSRTAASRQYWIPMIFSLSLCGFLVINVMLGLFGVLWFNIGKRRAEIGLRRALGATPGNISRQFIGEVFMVVGLSMLVGIFFALQFPLLGIELLDIPAVYYYVSIGITTGLIALLVLLCAYYPSRQASRVHPALALHEN